MRKRIIALTVSPIFYFITCAFSSAQTLEVCTVSDPTSTPLNVRSQPGGRIVGTLKNGTGVHLVGTASDARGRSWANVQEVKSRVTGWVFREFIACASQQLANQAWPDFWRRFRAAVDKHDRAALKRMMSAPFNENCALDGPPDTPTSAINNLDRGGWQKLSKSLQAGTTPWGSAGDLQRVTKDDPENLQLFKFGRDGKWRWLGCACWEC